MYIYRYTSINIYIYIYKYRQVYIYIYIFDLIHFTALYDVKHMHYHINEHKIQQVFTSLTYI